MTLSDEDLPKGFMSMVHLRHEIGVGRLLVIVHACEVRTGATVQQGGTDAHRGRP